MAASRNAATSRPSRSSPTTPRRDPVAAPPRACRRGVEQRDLTGARGEITELLNAARAAEDRAAAARA